MIPLSELTLAAARMTTSPGPSTTASKTTSFTCFQQLPAELRALIWEATLPDDGGPRILAVHVHSELLYRILPSGMPTSIQRQWVWGSRHVGPVILRMSQPLVNHEARAIAVKWLKQSGFKPRYAYGVEGADIVYRRHYDPNRDAVYLPTDRWIKMVRLAGGTETFSPPNQIPPRWEGTVQYLGISESQIIRDGGRESMLIIFLGLLTLKGVWFLARPGPEDENPHSQGGMVCSCPWSFAPSPGPDFRWSSQSKTFVPQGNGEIDFFGSCYTLFVLRVGKELQDFLPDGFWIKKAAVIEKI